MLRGLSSHTLQLQKVSTNVSVFGTHSSPSDSAALTVCQELYYSFEDPGADAALDHLLAHWRSNRPTAETCYLFVRQKDVWKCVWSGIM